MSAPAVPPVQARGRAVSAPAAAVPGASVPGTAGGRHLAALGRGEGEDAGLRRIGLELVQVLAVLFRHAQTYETNNDVFRAPLARWLRLLGEAQATEGMLHLERLGPDLFANGVRLRPQLRTLRSFRAVEGELARLGIGGLAFDRPPAAGATGWLETLVAAAPGGGADSLNRQFLAAGCGEVEALPPRVEEAGEPGDRRERALRAYHEALDLIRAYMTRQDTPAALSPRRAKRIVHRLVDLSFEEGGGFSLAGLSALRGHDEYTFNHMVNVCVLAIAFGQRLGLRRTQIAQLGLCALYHDIGKLHVPLPVLNKRGQLSEEEWALMGSHTIYAARTLFPQIATGIDVVPRVLTALQHHLRFDGSGYPRLRVLRRQTLFTRITAIVDSFDAMTTLRVYQKARLPHQALAELQAGAGTHYDPLLVRAFINCMGIYPVGSLVRLRSGELAVVCESNPDPDRGQQPKVRLVAAAAGAPAGGQGVPAAATRELVDLASPGAERRQIAAAADPDEVGIDPAHLF